MGAAGSLALNSGSPLFSHLYLQRSFYFHIFCLGGIFRGILNTRTPMIIAFLISGTHLSLDYGLIYGHFGLPQLGLKGAGVAAWIAQFVGAATCLGIFFFSLFTAGYRAVKWRISLTRFGPLFRIGSDLAIRTGALRGSLVFATSCAARMGTSILSAHEIAFQLMLLCSEVIDGLAVAGQALVAKYLGAAQKRNRRCDGQDSDSLRRLSRALVWSRISRRAGSYCKFLHEQHRRQTSAWRRHYLIGRPISAFEWNRFRARRLFHRRPRYPFFDVGHAHRCPVHLRANFLDVA